MIRNAELAVFTILLIAFALALPACSVTNLEGFHARDGSMWSSYIITAEDDTTKILTEVMIPHDDYIECTYDEWVYPFSEEDKRETETILNRHAVLWHGDHYWPLIPVFDGVTLAIDVQYHGKTKEIWCNNNIPPALPRIPRDIIAYYQQTYPDVEPTRLPLPDPADPPDPQ